MTPQLPPREITRQAWTTAERIAAALILWTVSVVVLGLVVIVLAIAGRLGP